MGLALPARRRAAGGAQAAIPVYTTEGGWLHLGIDALVRQTLEAQQAGFKGAKLKVGKPLLASLVILTYVPAISLWLPRTMGF